MKSITLLLEIALKNLKNNNILITPSNFEKEFYSLLSDSDIILEDHEEFQYLIDSLDVNEKLSFFNKDKTTLNLAKILSNRVSNQELKQFLKHFIYFVSPSVATYNSNKLQDLIFNIAKKPHTLVNDDTMRTLRMYTDKRVQLDKQLFEEKTTDIKLLIDFFEKHLKNVILEHDTTKDEVLKIKDDLENLNLSNSSQEQIKHLQDEMLKIVNKFETALINSTTLLDENQAKCVDLYEQIEILQYNLSKAEEEKSTDFLTGTLTRRAYMNELERIENEYNVFDSYYAIIFYDIDFFKKINDTYGHESGDIILTKFANILNKLTRSGDIISRYGGEEFIALIHYGNEIEVKNYLQRVKNIISNNKFVANENKIDVRFSAGVTFRKKYSSYDETMKKADELLYLAKEKGRNNIILDDGEIL
ncbi:MAG: GGDEF domain-containing protein [Halarcobacter sp.]